MEQFLDFVQTLNVATKALQLYSAEHPRGSEALNQLHQSVTAMLDLADRVQIIASRDRLFVDRKPVVIRTPHVNHFMKLLSDRSLNGVILHAGVTPQELLAFVNLLNMKPQRISELGGASAVLSDADVTAIRISHVRFEELLDGEEIIDANSAAARGGPQSLADTPIQVLLNDLFKPLMQALKASAGADPERETPGFIRPETKKPPVAQSGPLFDPRRIVPFDLTVMEKRMIESGLLNHPEFLEAFSESIVSQEISAQANLLMSRETLPAGPLREVLDMLAPQLVLNIISGLAKDQLHTESQLPDMAAYLYAQLQPRDRSVDRLRSRLDALGIDRDQLEEMLEALSWENLTPEAKLERLSDSRFLFDLRPDRLLKFMRELLVGGRHDDFVAVVERYGAGMMADSADLRRSVTEAFMRVLNWATDPGFLPAEETVIQRLVLTHFLREPDQRLQPRCGDAVSSLIGAWIRGGKFDRVARTLSNLNSGVAASQLPWKSHAYESLLGQIARDQMPSLVPHLYAVDLDQISQEVFPVLTLLGAPAAAELIEELAREEDRSRRGRIVRAIKAIGRPALLPLRHAMSSSVWYLVRNALNILGDLGAGDLVDEVATALGHQDGRVRRAAARALSKIGGEVAEAALIQGLSSPDTELQVELLFSLASMKAESAVPAVAEIARSRKRSSSDDSIRERAIDTLGQIASPKAIPVLEELLRRKGILTASEAPEIRIAAAKALASINTAEAKLAIRKVAEAEPAGPTREQLDRFLEVPAL